MKYFMVAGVHGEFTKLKKELARNNFDENNSEHILCLVGNFMCRGAEQFALFQWLKKLHQNKKALIIKGNFDLLFVKTKFSIDSNLEKELKTNYQVNKIKDCSLKQYREKIREEIATFVATLPYFIEKKQFIIVNGGINPTLADWKKGAQDGIDWHDNMTWMFQDNVNRMLAGAFAKINKFVIAGLTPAWAYKYVIKNGVGAFHRHIPTVDEMSSFFKYDQFIGIEGSWNNKNSNGIVFVLEEQA